MRYTYLYLCSISFSLLSVLSSQAQETTNSTEETTPAAITESSEQVTQDPNTYGDWKISCPDPDPCRMAQSIVTAGEQKIILQMRIFKGEKPTALFSFPLGILLNTGWQIKIDNGKSQLLPFEICKEDGCHSGINIPNSLLNAMKRGNIMKVKFFDASQNAIEPKISLKGFTKAYGELK